MIDLSTVKWTNMAQEFQGLDDDQRENIKKEDSRLNRVNLTTDELKAIRRGLDKHKLFTKKSQIRHAKMDDIFRENIEKTEINRYIKYNCKKNDSFSNDEWINKEEAQKELNIKNEKTFNIATEFLLAAYGQYPRRRGNTKNNTIQDFLKKSGIISNQIESRHKLTRCSANFLFMTLFNLSYEQWKEKNDRPKWWDKDTAKNNRKDDSEILETEPVIFDSLVRIIDDKHQTIGSGFILSADGYIITCHHLIYNLDSIKVEYRGEIKEASWCKEHSNIDVNIAILKIDIENAIQISLDNIRNQIDSTIIHGFRNDSTNVYFHNNYQVNALGNEQYVKTISFYQQNNNCQLTNEWNITPRAESEFKAYVINDSVEKEISGGVVINKVGKAIGIVQVFDNQITYVMYWENIKSELKQLGRQIDHQITTPLPPQPPTPVVPVIVAKTYQPDYTTLLGRQLELEDIIDALINSQQIKVCGVYGFAGIGKTALVQEIHKYFSKNKHFSKNVWLSAAPDENNIRTMTFETVINKTANKLNRYDISKLRGETKYNKMRQILEEEPILLFLDNMETSLEPQEKIVQKLLPYIGSSKILLTSRERLFSEGNTQIYPTDLNGLMKEPAIQLMKDFIEQINRNSTKENTINVSKDDLNRVINAVGGRVFGYIPMGLKFITGQLDLFDLNIIVRRLEQVELFNSDGTIKNDNNIYVNFWKQIFISSSKGLDKDNNRDKKFLVLMNHYPPEKGGTFETIESYMLEMGFDYQSVMNSIRNTWKLSFLEKKIEIDSQESGNNKFKYYQHILSHKFVKAAAPYWYK